MILLFYFPLILSLSLLLAEKQPVSDKTLLCLTLFVLYYLPRTLFVLVSDRAGVFIWLCLSRSLPLSCCPPPTLFVLVSDRAGVCTLRCGRRPTGEPGRLPRSIPRLTWRSRRRRRRRRRWRFGRRRGSPAATGAGSDGERDPGGRGGNFRSFFQQE